MTNPKFWRPFIASLILTPVFILLGLGSAGAGHRDYVLARILFPYTMLAALFFDTIVAPFVALAIAQFPLYGIVLGLAARGGRFLSALVFILAAHVLAAAVCFIKFSENFQ
jgi:hypothetical protein